MPRRARKVSPIQRRQRGFSDPQAWQAPLRAELAHAGGGEDQDLITAARTLASLLKQPGHLGILGTEGAAGLLCHPIGIFLAAVDVTFPSTIALILLAAILCGSDSTCERVFRLLRWATNRPEPPAPSIDERTLTEKVNQRKRR
jgi:hypothetical protein